MDRRLAATIATAASQIAAKLTAANDAAEQARTRYEHAARLAINRVLFVALGCFALGALGMIFGVYISARVILPPPDIFQRQRQAEATVAELAAHGGDSILSYCETAKGRKRCIRTEERGSERPWGAAGETYRLIYGY